MIEERALSLNAARRIPWLRVLLSLLLGALGLWLLVRDVQPAELAAAFYSTRRSYVALALAVIVATILAKTLRWRLTYMTRPQAPPFGSLFWILVLGQLLNVLIPVRLGDLVRIYAVDRQLPGSKARTFGTLVVEKTLDILILVGTMAALLPVIVLPDFLSGKGFTLAAVALVAPLALYVLAYQTRAITALLERLAGRLPPALAGRLLRVIVAGLEGLAALRSRSITLALLGTAGLIGVLSVLTPYILFRATGLPFGLAEAALLHVIVTIGSVPPSTPANVLIFEALVAFTLRQLGIQSEATILSFAVVYHIVVILPQIALGSLAPSRGAWENRPPA